MQVVDWILIALLLAAAFRGWRLGVIKQVVSIVGIVAGLMLARMFCGVLGETWAPHLGGNPGVATGLAFVAIWVVVPANLCLLGEVVSTVLDKIIIVGKVNKIVGALFSIFKYALLLGAVVWAMMASKMFPDGTLDTSFMAVMLKSFSEAFYTSFMNAL